MPFSGKDFTIPANTTKADLAETTLKVIYGEIVGWFVGFPHGCLNRVGIQIYHGAVRLLPLTPDEWLHWSGFMFDLEEEYQVLDRPLYLTIYGYNEDTTNPHTVTVGAEMVEIPFETTDSLLKRVLSALVGA